MPGRTKSYTAAVKLPVTLPAGRHVFAVRVSDPSGAEPVDSFFAVDVN